jgi:hypothetical protein
MKLKALVSLILVLLACKTAFAGNAVNQLNVDLSPSFFSTQDLEDGLDLAAEMTFPVGPVLGVGILADAGLTNGKDNYPDSVYSLIGGEIFLGNHNIGRIGFGIASGRQTYSEDGYYGDDDITVTSDVVLESAELYLGDFTLGISGSDTESDIDGYYADQPDSKLNTYTLQYYPTDNIRLDFDGYTQKFDDGSAYFGIEDTEVKGKALTFEFQVTHMVSVFMEYDTNEDNFDVDTKSYFVGATIYFRGGDTLKDNDRWY